MAYGKAPEWLDELGIGPGEFFCDSKPRLRQMMTARRYPPVARLHACLILHSAGYQQELAVIMKRGRIVPLTPTEACTMSHVPAKHFREYMAELDACGLARCEGSVKRGVRMYAWVRPRSGDTGDPPPVARRDRATAFVRERAKAEGLTLRAGQSVRETPVWSDTVRTAMVRTKIVVSAGFVPARETIDRIEELARAAETAEMSLREALKGLRAQALLNKEEREEREESSSLFDGMTTTEVLNDLPPNPPAGNGRETHSDAGPTGNSRDRRRARRSASAGAGQGASTERLGVRGRRDQPVDAKVPDPDAAGREPASVPAQNKQNTAVLRAADVCPVVVAEAVAEAMPGCDQHILDTMYQRCVAAREDITPDELVQFVREVAPRARASRTARSLPAVFRQSMVSAVGTPSDVERIRRMLAAEARRQEQQRIETERFIQEQLADPDVPEAEKRQLIEWVKQLKSKGKPPT